MPEQPRTRQVSVELVSFICLDNLPCGAKRVPLIGESVHHVTRGDLRVEHCLRQPAMLGRSGHLHLGPLNVPTIHRPFCWRCTDASNVVSPGGPLNVPRMRTAWGLSAVTSQDWMDHCV